MSYREDYRSAERDAFWTLPRALGAILALVLGLGVVGHIAGWFGETGQVAQEQFGARAVLEKYEWFKDASAQLDKKQADIGVYEKRFTDLKATYAGIRSSTLGLRLAILEISRVIAKSPSSNRISAFPLFRRTVNRISASFPRPGLLQRIGPFAFLLSILNQGLWDEGDRPMGTLG
jgi:hypothetical protein